MVKPTKKQVFKWVGLGVVAILCVYGLISAVSATVVAFNHHMDEYATTRVLSRKLVDVKQIQVEVPVIKASDVTAEINSAIKDQLK